ncbi:putative ribonuclease H-like domain-containing protein [Tanacetum coccineum]
MDLETAQINTTTKLSLLKQGEYELWKLRIEQYFQVQHYALWDVIDNENSFKPVARTTTNVDVTSTSLIPGPVTADEKTQKKNDYKDAKTLFAAIQTRFGDNDATKKTQKTLLKQMYENFNAPNIESLDSILTGFRRLNKLDLDTMSFDDLYNNFKIVEQEVKRTANLISSLSSQNMAFMSSPSSTNEVNTPYEVNTANIQVSPASTQVSTASTQVSTANLSDATVYAFLANQPNRSQLVHEDLEQIHEDELEEMDLKWQLALLSMRTRSFSRRLVERSLSIEVTQLDMTSPSYMADDEVPTNMALMAFLDSEVHNDKTCSKTCLKRFETLKTQLDDLRIEFNKSGFNLATYKRGLTSVEEQLVFYKKNEVLFCEQIADLKRDISYKDSEFSELKSELEKLKQEKESNPLKIENFNNASKSLDKLIGIQIPDKSRKGLGFARYNVVPLPHTGLFVPPTLDLSNSGLKEFQRPEFEGYGPKISKSVSEDVSNDVRKSPDALLVEELVSDVDKFEKKTVFSTKIEFVKQQEKLVRKPVNYAKVYISQGPRGNQRNWNNQKSQQLGSDFVMYNKACFVCGSFDHLQTNCNYHQRERVVSGSNYTRVNYNYSAQKAHPSAQRNMVPRAVLMKNSLRTLNTARPVNTAHPKTIVYSARPMSHFSKSAQSTVKRPFYIRTTLTNKNLSQKVNTAKGNFYTARPKAVNTARPNTAIVNAVRANQGYPQQEDQGYVDSGCSRHMIWNMSYLSNLKEFDGGYVTFRGGLLGLKDFKMLLRITTAQSSFGLYNVCTMFYVLGDGSTSVTVLDGPGYVKSKLAQVLNVLDDELISQDYSRSVKEGAVLVRVKDTMRNLDSKMCAFVLDTMRRYISWIDIGLIANNTFLSLLFELMLVDGLPDKLRCAASGCVLAVVAKRMDLQAKLTLLQSLQMSQVFGLVAGDVDSELVSGLDSLLIGYASELLDCLKHLNGEDLKRVSVELLNKVFPLVFYIMQNRAKGGRITGKGTLKTGKLDFEDVYFVKELQFNLFSVSQMCDKKNNVLFTNTGCFVLSPDFKLTDESQVLLKVPRKNNMYSVDMKNIVPKESLTCLVAKATLDESMLWHRRLGIKREFSVARTPQQNGVAERRNRTLIEAARTMLADSKLPTTFWAKAVNTACKFDGKSDDGFFVGYSLNSKDFKVYNIRTRKVEENLHVRFLEDKPIIAGACNTLIFNI